MSHILIEKINQREKPFLMIDKTPLFDPRYSWAEKGMLATLLATKSDGSVKLTEMHHFSSDGEAATKTAQKGLKKLGHLKVINEGGRWFAEVFEEPIKAPVFTFEKRKKPSNKLADILKENGLSDAQIAKIVAQVETEDTEKQPQTAVVKLEVPPPSVSDIKPLNDRDLVLQYTEKMKLDTDFISKMILDYKITDIQLGDLLREFVSRPAALGTPNTESYEKFAQHFYHWVPKNSKAKQQRANMAKKNGKPVLPTHDEILTELQRGILMIYASTAFGFTYLAETIETTIHWIEKAAKLQLNVDTDTQKKAEYILKMKGNETKQKDFFEFLKRKEAAKKNTETIENNAETIKNSAKTVQN